MRFHLTEEQNYIQKATLDFTKGEFDDDQILELMENGCFPEKMFKNACKLDLIGLTYPENAGGQACGMMDQVLVIEALCRRDSTMGIALSTVDMGVELIARHGEKKLIGQCVAPLLKGKAVAALVCPELGEQRGTVRYREGDDTVVLDGDAPLVLNAGIADYFIVVAHADTGDNLSAGKKIVGIVPGDTKGVAVGKPCDKLGLDMLAWHRVAFEDVEIPKGYLITAGPEGTDPVMALQESCLLKISAMYLGIAQGAFDLALGYAREREQFGRKIARFQGISQKISLMYIKLQEARAAVYNAAGHYDKGAVDLHDLIAAKLSAETAAEMITDEALQIHGGVGYMVEFPIEHFFRDIKCLRTFMGRKIFQMDLISQKLIGKIR